MKLIKPYEKKAPQINSIKITKEAFEKINLYAEIVSEIIGSDKECVGALLNDKNKKDNITRDIHLYKDQVVTAIDGLPRDYFEPKGDDMEMVGLWHSHGGLGVFHSKMDEEVLTNLYNHTKNMVFNNQREQSIDYIIEGKEVRILQEGGNSEIRIKGNIYDIRGIKRDGYYTLNSIVINKNSYLGGYKNPVPQQNYDAEIWIGPNELGGKREVEKKAQHAFIDLVNETNNIKMDKENLVREVGEKVIFQETRLKDMPEYQKVLDKYTKKDISTTIKAHTPEFNEGIDQIIEESLDDTKKKVSLESILPVSQKSFGNGYYSKIHDFYSVAKKNEDVLISLIGRVGEILAGDYQENGKRYWFWDDRIKKAEKVYKRFKRGLGEYHQVVLGDLLDLINVNYYARKNYGKKLKKMCKKMGFKNKIKKKKSKGKFFRFFRRRKK